MNLEEHTSGTCADNRLTEDECKKAADSKETWYWGLYSGDNYWTIMPAGCTYTGSGAVWFNKAEGTNCSTSYTCLCKRQGKIVADMLLLLP